MHDKKNKHQRKKQIQINVGIIYLVIGNWYHMLLQSYDIIFESCKLNAGFSLCVCVWLEFPS